MTAIEIARVQAANLIILVFLSGLALDAWWKVCLFGIVVMLFTSIIAFRHKRHSVALTYGSLPIAWLCGVAIIVGGAVLGISIG